MHCAFVSLILLLHVCGVFSKMQVLYVSLTTVTLPETNSQFSKCTLFVSRAVVLTEYSIVVSSFHDQDHLCIVPLTVHIWQTFCDSNVWVAVGAV